MSDCCKELKWLRLLMDEIDELDSKKTPLLDDNIAAQLWSKNLQSMKCAKHIDVRHCFVKQCVNGKFVTIERVDKNGNHADGFASTPICSQEWEKLPPHGA